MITNNAQSPKVGSSVMSFEEWKRANPTLVQKLDEQQLLQAYQEYERSAGGQQQSSATNPATGIEDISEEKQTTELNNKKPINNIDLMGAVDTFTQFGIATGNSGIAKAGVVGSTLIDSIQRVKGLKGLKGKDKTAGALGIAGGAADTLDSVLFGDQRAKNSSLTNGMNDVYDTASSAIMSMGPYGAMIGGAMKVGGLLSDGLTALGVGTDQMTTTDKILDSKFMKLTPVGLINGIFSSTSDRFTVDNSLRQQIGSSYGGAYAFMDDAASRAGKEYGLFSGGAKDDANRDIARSKRMQSKIGNINKDARDRQSIATNTSGLLTTNYQFNLSGGLDQRYLRAAKIGAKLERIKKIDLTFKKGGIINNVINLDTKEIEWQPVYLEPEDDWKPSYKSGGVIEEEWKPVYVEEEWQPTYEIESMKKGNKVKKTERKYKTYEDFVKYLGDRGKSDDYDLQGFYNDNDAYFDWEDMEDEKPGEAHFIDKYKLPNHITFSTESKYSNAFTKGGEWIEDDNGVTYVTSPYVEKLHSLEEMIKYFRKYEPGVNLVYNGMMIPAVQPQPFTPKELKEGGKTDETEEEPLSNQQNVIPEGALHARKHHMENAEDYTKKGIPVIDNKGEQQAEIELNEIIFNLEVTQKLEELCRDGSDEAAIEAGKLLVQEILFNTEDRTGLISTLKQGGTINGNN